MGLAATFRVGSTLRGLVSFALCATIACIVEAPARADDSMSKRTITSQGAWLFGGTFSGFWSSADRGSDHAYLRWSVSASPSLLYFLRDRIGVGGFLTGSIEEVDFSYVNTRSGQLMLGLTSAFDVRSSERVSFLFQPYVGYLERWTTRTPFIVERELDRDWRASYVRVGLTISLLVHLSPYLAIGFGPDVLTDIGVAIGDEKKFDRVLNRKTQRASLRVGLATSILASF